MLNLSLQIKSYSKHSKTESEDEFQGVSAVLKDGRECFISSIVIKKEKTQYSPDRVSSPGETIWDLMDERGWTVEKLATKLSLITLDAHKLLKGKYKITNTLADKLGEVFGTDANFWLNRYKNYEEYILKKRELKNGSRNKAERSTKL